MHHLSAFLSAFVDFSATGRIHKQYVASNSCSPSSTSSAPTTITSPPPTNYPTKYPTASPSNSSVTPSPAHTQWVFPPAARLVAVGDLHGDLGAAQRAFRLAGLVDEKGHWTGGSAVCVQVGDLLDRGLEEIPLVYWMDQVAAEAKAAGGQVVLINGNHEYMNIAGRFRYADPDTAPAYDQYMRNVRFAEALKRRCGQPHEAIPDVPDSIAPVFRSRFAALRPGGPLTKRFFADKNTVARVGRSLFVHAGLLPHHLDYGIARMNAEAKSWLAKEPGTHRPSFLNTADSLVWTRLYSHPDEGKTDCRPLVETFARTGAVRMVVGHSVHENVTSRCQGGVLCVDVGLSHGLDGGPQVLEILHDSEVRVLSDPGPDGRATKVEKVDTSRWA